jgi:oligopeptide/dipeptide ABC transporter ATP-binding protein
MEKEVLLQIKNLTVSLNHRSSAAQIIKGVAFEVAKGEKVGILGESGSGKTMSATSIIGLNKDVSGLSIEGSIIYKGQDLLSLRDADLNKVRGKEISYIFQDPVGSLNPYRRVGKQIEEVLRVHGLKSSNEQVLQVMRDVGLDNAELIFNMYPFQLSGGQAQRVLIAMAIVCKPDLLIADEPISAIDASLQKKVLDLLENINARYGTSIIIITHDFAVARYLCDKVVIMYSGLVMEQGSMQQVLGSPRHPYTIELLKCVDSLVGNAETLYTLEGRAPNPLDAGPGCPFYERCNSKQEICLRSLPELVQVREDHDVRCVQVSI